MVSLPDFLYDYIQVYIPKLYGFQQNDRIFYFTELGFTPLKIVDRQTESVSQNIAKRR